MPKLLGIPDDPSSHVCNFISQDSPHKQTCQCFSHVTLKGKGSYHSCRCTEVSYEFISLAWTKHCCSAYSNSIWRGWESPRFSKGGRKGWGIFCSLTALQFCWGTSQAMCSFPSCVDRLHFMGHFTLNTCTFLFFYNVP